MVKPGQAMYHCVECGHMCEVEWPPNADEIWEVLSERPAPKNRNWYPSGHPVALRANLPHGQSVQELRDEAAEMLGGQ